MQNLESTEDVNQTAILLLAEHYGIIRSAQSEQVRAAMSNGGAVCQHLTEMGIVDASDLTLLRRKLADLQQDLGSEQSRLNHSLGGNLKADFTQPEESTYLQTSFIDDSEAPDQVQEDWQPGVEYLIDRYVPFLRIFDGFRIHLLVCFVVLAVIAAIFWWPTSEFPNQAVPNDVPPASEATGSGETNSSATSSLFDDF